MIVAKQALILHRYPNIIVFIASNHGYEVFNDSSFITCLIESCERIKHRIIDKDSPIRPYPDIPFMVFIKCSNEILA